MLSGKGLNFKNVFNSFKVDKNDDEPKTFTFNLCIF